MAAARDVANLHGGVDILEGVETDVATLQGSRDFSEAVVEEVLEGRKRGKSLGSGHCVWWLWRSGSKNGLGRIGK